MTRRGFAGGVIRSLLRRACRACVVAVLPAAAGCWGAATMSLSAADALDAVGEQMATALHEYHAEVEAADDAKEAAAIAAFVVRLQKDAQDEGATASHTAAFTAAMARLRADRRVEWQRRAAALDNVRLLNEVTGGLRQVAIESMTLRDELGRYITDLIEARQQAAEQTSTSQNVKRMTTGP